MKRRNRIITFTLISALILALALIFCSCSDEGTYNGIKSSYINGNGELVLNYTDGTSEVVGVVVGKDGKDGENGLDGRDGKDGLDGKDGENGLDGKDGRDGKDGEITVVGEAQSISLAASKAARSAVDVICDEGAGSGVIYKYNEEDDGYFIITNYHVVYSSTAEISESIQILLYGNEYADSLIDASYVGGSMNYDIAILYVENNDLIKDSACVPVSVADSNTVSIGDTSIAIGNSEGYGLSVTSGIVSVDSENLELTAADNKTKIEYRVLRTDTAINHGNSGGGLFNDKGELIGIVNAKSVSTSVEGMGYAIPSTLACNIADNIIDNCYKTDQTCVKRALLGITVSCSKSVSIFDPDTGKISIVETIYVVDTTSTCLFGEGIKANDVIKAIVLDGKEELTVTRQFHVIDYLLQARVGDTGTLTVERINEETNETEEVKLSFEITNDSIVDYK
ncbi:MAG: trypsin-like peptidase domain-containing protein [Clostridia bacterium]|nr:trypsin-like peptidase domain-containing protein [Clostridia bacterium]